MKLTLKYNKRMADVFRHNMWDIYSVNSYGQAEYLHHWVVELSDKQFRLAHNEQGKTILSEPQPTKELALDYFFAQKIAERLERQ